MTLKRQVGDKAKVVAEKHGHGFKIGQEVEITAIHPDTDPPYYDAQSENTIGTWGVAEYELDDPDPSVPMTPDEFYQKTRQLVRLQTLVEYIDETDTRSLTTSGADFLDEVKRLIEELKVQLGFPKV